MHRLRDEGIPEVLISGNHDAANRMPRSLRMPDNVELPPHTEASTVRMAKLADLGVAIHGRSFANQAEFDNFAQGYVRKQSGMGCRSSRYHEVETNAQCALRLGRLPVAGRAAASRGAVFGAPED